MSTLLTPDRGLRWFFDLTKSLPDKFQRARVWSPRSIMVWLMLMTFPDRKTAYRPSLRFMESFGLRKIRLDETAFSCFYQQGEEKDDRPDVQRIPANRC